eukprot:symbB.v1.2.019333.t1/scaffold1577.1/size110854/11
MELTSRSETRRLRRPEVQEIHEVIDSLEKGELADEESTGQPLGCAGQVASAFYLLLSLGHLLLIYVQSISTTTDGGPFLLLSGLQVCLAFEACVYAAGGLS